MQTNKRTYTMTEVQEMLGISKTTCYKLAHSHAFPVVRLGKLYLSPIVAFDEWLNGKGD